MSFMERYKFEFAQKVRHYSQEEGLKDHEIAELLGCSRATVNRTRQAEGVPTVNLRNRLDKRCVCQGCRSEYLIRRKERRQKLCPDCAAKATKNVTNNG